MEHFPGWMVESAYRYLRAAELPQQDSLQKDEALVNAVAGMEILLSSFVSTQDDNAGKADETYKLDMVLINAAHAKLQQLGKVLTDKPDKHDVLTLFHAIPESTRRRVGLDRYESLIDQYRKVSTIQREVLRYDSDPGTRRVDSQGRRALPQAWMPTHVHSVLRRAQA